MKNLHKYKILVKKFKGELSLLADHGFKKSTRTYAQVWVNKRANIVVKKPYLICRRMPKLKNIIPTLWFRMRGEDYFVQPLAKRHRPTQALNAFAKLNKIDWISDDIYDLHAGNIGWYKGKPMLFDW